MPIQQRDNAIEKWRIGCGVQVTMPEIPMHILSICVRYLVEFTASIHAKKIFTFLTGKQIELFNLRIFIVQKVQHHYIKFDCVSHRFDKA